MAEEEKPFYARLDRANRAQHNPLLRERSEESVTYLHQDKRLFVALVLKEYSKSNRTACPFVRAFKDLPVAWIGKATSFAYRRWRSR